MKYKVDQNKLTNYRWKILLERKGGGKAVWHSLANWVFDMLASCIAWIYVRVAVKKHLPLVKCDVLLLEDSLKAKEFNKNAPLQLALREQNYLLAEHFLSKPREILFRGLFKTPHNCRFSRYYWMRAYIEHLLSMYSPKMVLNLKNGSFFTPFIREWVANQSGKLVHIAHAATVEESWKLTMNDYDYYLLFGRSSFDFLERQEVIFGTSNVLLVGSSRLSFLEKINANIAEQNNILLLGSGPVKEKEAETICAYELIAEWIRLNPKFKLIVKPHPKSDAVFWRSIADELCNVVIASPRSSLINIIEESEICLADETNAVIEASLCEKPVILINPSNKKDVFSVVDFFGLEVRESDELEEVIGRIKGDYQNYQNIARQFSRYHLENSKDGLSFTLDAIELLLKNKQMGSGLKLVERGV